MTKSHNLLAKSDDPRQQLDGQLEKRGDKRASQQHRTNGRQIHQASFPDRGSVTTPMSGRMPFYCKSTLPNRSTSETKAQRQRLQPSFRRQFSVGRDCTPLNRAAQTRARRRSIPQDGKYKSVVCSAAATWTRIRQLGAKPAAEGHADPRVGLCRPLRTILETDGARNLSP